MDLMRVVSALLIFYYHAGILIYLPLSRFGDYAVSTFIVLAVVASMSLGKRTDDVTFWEYLSRRLKRIFPLYLTINLLIFAASYLSPSRLGRPYSIGELLLSTFGLSQYFAHPYLSEVFWFIPFIVQVYVIIAAFGKRLLELNWVVFFAAGICVSGISIFILNSVMGDNLSEMRKWSPLLRLPEVGFGFMTAAVLSGVLSIKRYAGYVLIYLGFVAILACGSLVAPRAAYLFSYPLVGLAVTAGVTAIGLGLRWVVDAVGVSPDLLRFLGRATFPFFLIHGAGMRFIHHKYDAQALAWAGYLLACIGAAIIFEFIFSALTKQRLPRVGMVWRK